MGRYASQADLKARFENDAAVSHLTDTGSSGVPDGDVLDEVIGLAEGEIDGYVGVRYQTPVAVDAHASLASQMRSMTLDLAVRALYARHNRVSDPIQGARDAVIAILERIAAGTFVLASPDTEPSTAAREPLAAWGTSNVDDPNSNRVFSRRAMQAL